MNPDEEEAPSLDALEAGLREVGLYLDQATWMPDAPHPTVVLDVLVGDLAFSKRVQDPVQQDFDASFRQMAREMTAADFAATREQIMKEGLDV